MPERLVKGWRGLADPLSIGIAITDGPDHRVRYFNPRFAEITRAPAETTGAPLEAVVPEAFRKPLLPLLDRVLEGEASASVDMEVTPEDGSDVVCRCTVSPLTVDGERVGAVVELHDISEHVEGVRRHVAMEHEIREVNERLVLSALREQELAEKSKVAAQAKSDFLSAVSHELRTPLTAIMGFSEVLECHTLGPLNEQQQTSVERISDSARHLRDLINEVLTFQQLNTVQATITSSTVDAGELASGCLNIVRGLAAGDLELRLDLPAHELPMKTDAQKLRQILVNLLSNAIKFTETGWVELKTRSHGDRVVFAVTDTGLGIEEHEIEEIFQPFTQLNRGYNRTVDGTGLGLSISRHLVGLLGGEITVDSTPGEGSTFTVSVPDRLPERD
jgi:PAS domain S-box-containing protein